MNIEDDIKDKLGIRSLKKIPGSKGGGCINEGYAYEADDDKLFIKKCDKEDALDILTGEMASLKALRSTGVIRVPEAKCVLPEPDDSGAVIVLEYIEMSSLRKYQSQLGHDLAELHAYNQKQEEKYLHDSAFLGKHDNNLDELPFVTEFGFESVTYCGALAMNNDWIGDWISFFARHRLQDQLNLIESNHGDREARELWSQLQVTIPRFFKSLEEDSIKIKPCLLHGDLWSGNAAETPDSPVVFDPATFFGHHEYDLSISGMFGGFNRQFYSSYFSTTPEVKKQKGFESRQDLYQLFHYLNHWNHFGGGYRQQSLSLMKKLVKNSQAT